MDKRIKITRLKTEHYLECFECAKPKETRFERKNRLCRECSDKTRRLEDSYVTENTKMCIKCEKDFPNNNDFFHWKDKQKGRLDRTCKNCDLQRRKQWSIDNPERDKEIRKQEFKRNEPKRLQTPSYHLKRRVSSCISNTLSKRGVSKDHPTWQSLPYSPKDLADHLEKQFDENMNWDNYGSYWHIDHIHPQSLLPYDSLLHENFIKCWALDNLRPLEKIENIKKSNKI